MCVAAIIKNPVSLEYLEAMDHDNPHGGGVACVRDGQLWFKRGLGPVEIHALQESGALTFPYMLHFRWATHGEIVPELTHPFPIGGRALLGELEGETERVLIHNGVWHDYLEWLSVIDEPTELLEKASDTAIAAYLLGFDTLQNILEEIQWATAVGSVQDGALHVEKNGRWYDHSDGNEYSNLMWLPAKEWFAAHKSTWSLDARSKSAKRETADSGWDWKADYNIERKADFEQDCEIETIGGINYAWNGKEYVVVDGETGTPLARATDDWEEYVRARYGDDTAAAIQEDAITMPHSDDFPDEWETDLITEDPEAVNSWIAKQFLRSVKEPA